MGGESVGVVSDDAVEEEGVFERLEVPMIAGAGVVFLAAAGYYFFTQAEAPQPVDAATARFSY